MVAVFISTLSLILPVLYKLFWSKILNNKETSKGYGIVIITLLLISYIYKNYSNLDYFILGLFLLTFIYWLDDLFHLKIIYRVIVVFIASFFILKFLNFNYSYFFILFAICFTLTNFINFMDGEDLNLSTMIFFFLLYLLVNNHLYNFINSEYLNIFILMLIGFTIYNFFPKNIYFGDAGCFGLAIFLTIMLSYEFENDFFNFIILILPLFYLLLDCAYVILIRLHRKEKLLSRNYLHLYQLLKKKYKSKIYLFLYPIYLLILTLLINFLNIINEFSFFKIFIILMISLFFYISLRILLINEK